MRDEVREKVGQNPEQGQARDAVGCKNPRSPAFTLPDGGSRSRGLFLRRNDRGPIFHAKTSDGKIVAQIRYASRLPRVAAKQDYLDVILPRIEVGKSKKCDLHHSTIMQNDCHHMIINLGLPSRPLLIRVPFVSSVLCVTFRSSIPRDCSSRGPTTTWDND